MRNGGNRTDKNEHFASSCSTFSSLSFFHNALLVHGRRFWCRYGHFHTWYARHQRLYIRTACSHSTTLYTVYISIRPSYKESCVLHVSQNLFWYITSQWNTISLYWCGSTSSLNIYYHFKVLHGIAPRYSPDLLCPIPSLEPQTNCF